MSDSSILDIYVEHGLRVDPSSEGMRLKYPSRHGAYLFVNIRDAVFPIMGRGN